MVLFVFATTIGSTFKWVTDWRQTVADATALSIIVDVITLFFRPGDFDSGMYVTLRSGEAFVWRFSAALLSFIEIGAATTTIQVLVVAG